MMQKLITFLPLEIKRFLRIAPFNLFVWALLILYLLPVMSMIVTGMMPTEQLGDENAPLYPARIMQYSYQGKDYQIYNVPTDNGIQQWALIEPGTASSLLIDPKDPTAELFEWKGSWNSLTGVYEFHPA